VPRPSLSPSDSADARARLVGTLTILTTLLAWTSIPLFLRYFADFVDPWTSNGWRYGISALLWAPLLLWRAKRRSLPKGLFVAALVPAFVNSLGQICFTTAHYQIEPGLLTFGLRTQMVFVAVGAYLLFPAERKVITAPRYLVGLVALAIGTSMAVLAGNEPMRGGTALGILLAVASGMLFAGYGLSVRKFMSGYRSVVAFAAISQYTAFAMLVLMLVLGDRAGLTAFDHGLDIFALLLLSGVIGIGIGHVLYYISIARLGVAISAGVLQLHPFTVAIASYFLFGEILTPAQWTGGCIALAGAVAMLSVQGRLQPSMPGAMNVKPSPESETDSSPGALPSTRIARR
jgi:drug/metabolite transporter (DMT)-like permease